MPQLKTKNSKLKTMPFGVIILGAGASLRMGRSKLLLSWRGTTVIGHLISQWQELGAAQIAVVLRAGDAALAAELDRLQFPRADRIENPQPERGMFSSVTCAAAWRGWRPEISRWALALGDQPHLQTKTLQQLLDFAAQNPAAICQPEFGGRAGHPVIFPPSAFGELKDSNVATLKEFWKLCSLPRVQCPGADAGVPLDMDTPEDYKRLLDSSA